MVSDDERREIVASLRESSEFISGLPYVSLGEKAFATFDRILACVGYERGNIFDYLADLIDRPTTHINVNEHGRACCANCGCDDWCLAEGSRYCPNCGVEVVHDD